MPTRIDVLVLVRPYLLGSALARALDAPDRRVTLVNCDDGVVPTARYEVVVTTEGVPSTVDARAVIELPPADSRSFGAVHLGNTTQVLALDHPVTVDETLEAIGALLQPEPVRSPPPLRT